MQRAETLQVGDLELHNIPLLIEDHPIADGIQGAMPLSFFFGFLIRLDIPGKNLDLLPYPDQQSSPDSGFVVFRITICCFSGELSMNHARATF